MSRGVQRVIAQALSDFWKGDVDWPLIEDQADAIVEALRALPVAERMEAMGMRPFTNNHLTAPSLWQEALDA